jgi:hypothetical protein
VVILEVAEKGNAVIHGVLDYQIAPAVAASYDVLV